MNAGAEIGVASTKAYTSQFVCLTLLTLAMGEDLISNGKRIREVRLISLKVVSGSRTH